MEREIKPGITLYHWDLPAGLQDAGGWPARDTALRFADYAAILFAEFADAGADWFTINEPKTQAFVGHWYGPRTGTQRIRMPPRQPCITSCSRTASRCRRSGHPERASGIGIALNLLPDLPGVSRLRAGRSRRREREPAFLDPVLLGSYPDDAIGETAGQLPSLA